MNDLKTTMRGYEKRHIEVVLSMHSGDKAKAAKTLAIGLSTLYRKMNTLSIERRTYGRR